MQKSHLFPALAVHLSDLLESDLLESDLLETGSPDL
jgi:hypothetical protein